MIKVLLVDDHMLVRHGIRRILEDVGGIEVVKEVGSGEEAIEAVRKIKPDVVLMDISMPGIGGLEATRRIAQIAPKLPVIIVTVHVEAPFPSQLLQAGAMGYISKGGSIEEMVRAIRDVHMGQRFISPEIAQNLALSLLPGQGGGEEQPFDKLSSREMQVMLMLVQGGKVQDIATQLNLSPKTISTYRYRLFDKLKVKNDADLTRMAIRYKLIDG